MTMRESAIQFYSEQSSQEFRLVILKIC